LEQRVIAAAEEAVARQQFVSAVDVLVGIGWLPSAVVGRWRRGGLADLEGAAAVDGSRLAGAVDLQSRAGRGPGAANHP
jgi:hypothetical protein